MKIDDLGLKLWPKNVTANLPEQKRPKMAASFQSWPEGSDRFRPLKEGHSAADIGVLEGMLGRFSSVGHWEFRDLPKPTLKQDEKILAMMGLIEETIAETKRIQLVKIGNIRG